MKAPVQLAGYRLKKLHFEIIKDFEIYDIEKALFSIDVDYEIYSNNEDPNQYKVDLFLEIIPSVEEEMHLPYKIEMVLEGVFFFEGEEELEDEEKAYHLNISSPTMLYGAARSTIHQLTGETSYGAISIPAIQFSKIAEEKQKSTQEQAD